MKISRRSFIMSTGALALMTSGCAHASSRRKQILVNDVQSRLNPTYVNTVVSAESLSQLQRSIQQAADRGESISMCGGKHAMGAQQFLSNGTLLDTRNMARVLDFNATD